MRVYTRVFALVYMYVCMYVCVYVCLQGDVYMVMLLYVRFFFSSLRESVLRLDSVVGWIEAYRRIEISLNSQSLDRYLRRALLRSAMHQILF